MFTFNLRETSDGVKEHREGVRINVILQITVKNV